MIDNFFNLIITYGLNSFIIAKFIEIIGTVLPTPLRPIFYSLLRYKIPIKGIPFVITGEMIIGFIIGKMLLGL